MSRWFLSAVLIVLLGTPSVSQRIVPTSPLLVDISVARFRGTDSTGFLEVYFSVHPRTVTLVQTSSGWSGGVRLDLELRANDDASVYARKRLFVPVAISDTAVLSMGRAFVTMVGFGLPFRSYGLFCRAWDSLNVGRVDSVRTAVTIDPFRSAPSVSDIEFCTTIEPAQGQSSPFVKNTLEVVPNPSHVYGMTSSAVVGCYAEFYNLDTAATYRVRLEAIDGDGRQVKQGTKVRRYMVRHAVEVGSMAVPNLASGKYRCRLTLTDTLDRALAVAERWFFVFNPHIAARTPRAELAASAEFAGMTANEMDEEFQHAKMIATPEEVKLYASIGSLEGRREFLATFWTAAGNGRGGIRPMTRWEFLRSVTAANEKFGSASRDGWRTDRGRVLILYGEPDEVDRYPSEGDSKPYEIWNYHSIENGVTFVFVDRTSFGNYQLVHSTKRGELQDDGWQRYLR